MNTIITLVVILAVVAVVWVLLNTSTAKLKIPNLKLPKFFQKKKTKITETKEEEMETPNKEQEQIPPKVDWLTLLLMKITLFFTIGGEIRSGHKHFKMPGIGISLNRSVVYIITILPGILITTALYIILKILLTILFEIEIGSFWLTSSNWIWLGITAFFAVQSAKKYTRTVTIEAQSVQRLEIQGQGIVKEVKNSSYKGGGAILFEYLMLTEGTYRLPWFANVSTRKLSLRPMQFKTEEITARAKDGFHVKWVFSETLQIENAGLYFSANPEGTDNFHRKRSILKSTLIDFTQSFDSDLLMAMTGKEMKKILVLSNQEDIRVLRNEILKSDIENYNPSKTNLSGVHKIIQSILIKTGIWLYEENARKAEFEKIRSQITTFVGKISGFNISLGVVTIDINQEEMNYASKEVKMAAEEAGISKLQIKATSLLKEEVDKYLTDWKEYSVTPQQIIEYLQVQLGKRTAHNFDGSQSSKVKPMFSIKDKDKKND